MCPRGAQCAPTCPYLEPPRRPARRSRPTRRGPWAMAAKPRSGTPLARVRWPGIRRIHGAAALPVGVAPCTSRGPANRMAQGRSSERRARRQDGGRCGDVPPRVRGRRSRPPRIGPSTGRALDLPSKGLRREAAPGDLDRANHVIEAEPDGDGRQGAAPPRDRPCVPGRWHARRAHGVAARSRGWTRSSAPGRPIGHGSAVRDEAVVPWAAPASAQLGMSGISGKTLSLLGGAMACRPPRPARAGPAASTASAPHPGAHARC